MGSCEKSDARARGALGKCLFPTTTSGSHTQTGMSVPSASTSSCLSLSSRSSKGSMRRPTSRSSNVVARSSKTWSLSTASSRGGKLQRQPPLLPVRKPQAVQGIGRGGRLSKPEPPRLLCFKPPKSSASPKPPPTAKTHSTFNVSCTSGTKSFETSIKTNSRFLFRTVHRNP